MTRWTAFSPYLFIVGACTLLVGVCSLPAMAEIKPLIIEAATATEISWLQGGDFTASTPGAKLGNWSAGALVAGDDAEKTPCLEIKKVADKTGGVSYSQTIPLEMGHTYRCVVQYRTDMDGVQLEMHQYGFSTWGDTVRPQRVALPKSPDDYQRVEVTLTPAPGAICVGTWISVPAKATGTLRLRQYALFGPPWGGMLYPTLTPKEQMQPDCWHLAEYVRNSVPINSQYFGPGAQNTFLRQRGAGNGDPWVPVGAIIPAKTGNYRIGLEVRENDGGKLLAQYTGTYNQPNDTLPAARIRVPDITRPCQLELVGWNADGTLVGKRTVLVRFQTREPFTTPAVWDNLPAQRDAWPGGGQVSVSLNGTMVQDYHPGQEIKGTITATRGTEARTIHLTVTRYDRLKVSEQDIAVNAGQGKATIALAFTPPNADVYEVNVSLRSGDRVLDERELRIGLREAVAGHPLVKPDFPSLELTEEQRFASQHTAPAAETQFAAFLQDVKAHGSTVAGIGYSLSEFNPMPGVYRFAELERRVKLTADAGLHAEIYLQPQAWPDWAGWEAPVDQNGKPDDCPSIASAGVRRIVADAYRTLAMHFRDNPTVVSYGMWGTWFDWVYRDGDGQYYDYSPSALALWKIYSNGLPAPQPSASGPDLRPEWKKWAAFRGYLVKLWYVETFGETVRAVDSARWLSVYAYCGGNADIESIWPDFKRLKITPAHGGSDPRDFSKQAELAYQYGVGFRHESVSAPERHPLQADLVLFHSLFNGLPTYTPPAFNIAWNIGWNVTHDNPGVKNALDRKKTLSQLLSDLSTGGYNRAPNQWAQYCSWDDMLLGAHDFQWHSLSASLELGDMFEHINHDAVSDRSAIDAYRRYKLLFSLAPSIITAETSARIRAYVEAGGTFAVVLKPGPGMAEFSKSLLGIDVTNVEVLKQRIDGVGVAPWLSSSQHIYLDQSVKIVPPIGAQPVLTAANGTPLAWVQPLGKGNILVFLGTPDLQRSVGFLENLLHHVGVKRLYNLQTIGEANESYPAEGLLFSNAQGQTILLVHRAIRWNAHRQMLDKANSSGAVPTWDGFATIFPRKDVAVSYFPAQPGTYLVERWAAGQWTEIGRFTGDIINTAELKLNLAPGEVGAIRFTRIP